MKITSKAQFFEMWKKGLLGNRTRLWDNPDDAFFDCIIHRIKEVGFREIRTGAGSGAWCIVPKHLIWDTAAEWTQLGRKFVIDDACPNHLTTLVGEVCRSYRGLEGMLAANSGCGMRDAQKKGLLLPRTGATILVLLDKFMDPSSRDDLNDLLDLYPDATVEFSCFSVNVGVIPNRNTIMWETRNY